MRRPANEILYPVYAENVPPVIEELADTPAMKRLKKVGMNCGLEYTSFPLYSTLNPYSRFDHSLGVAYIIWNFTHDLTQTCAGLFHDISTPVFAHVIDFMNGDHLSQESTEETTEKTIRESKEIMDILQREGILVKDVADYHIYPVADNPSGRLSADRLEYTLGNFLNYGFADYEDCVRFYKDLTVGINEFNEPEIMFRDAELARDFSLRALKNSVIYSQDPDRYAMEYLASIIRKSISRRVFNYADLWKTEDRIIEKMKSDPEIAEEWRKYCGFSRVLKSCREETGEGWLKVDAKRRYIDPYILYKGRAGMVYEDVRKGIDAFRNESYDYSLKAE